MSEEKPGKITKILQFGHKDNQARMNEVMDVVYDELRILARIHLNKERIGHTLDSVALVNEVYVKLTKEKKEQFANRSQFFALAAQSMRRILIDHARTKMRGKRGGGEKPIPFDEIEDLVGNEKAEYIFALDEALEKLEQVDERASKVIMCRFFAGMTLEETAEGLEISVMTVRRDEKYARAYLYDLLNEKS